MTSATRCDIVIRPLALALLTAAPAAAQPEAAEPVAVEAPTIAPHLIELDASLRRRRMADLRALIGDEGTPERAQIRLMLAETLVEHARALRLDIVPDAPTDPSDQRALQGKLHGEARQLLRLAYQDAEQPEIRDRAGLLWADLLILEGSEVEARALLADIEATSSASLARARAAEHQARLFEVDIDLEAQREALAAYERALIERPTISNRRGAARAAEQVGDFPRALAHYRHLLTSPTESDEMEAIDARRYAARAVAQIVSRWTPIDRAVSHIEGLGERGAPVWRFAGQALLARQQYASARLMLRRAIERDEMPDARLTARSDLIDVALHLDDRALIASQIGPVGEELDAAGEALPRRISEHVERALRLVVRQIHVDPHEAWSEATVDGVIGLYLSHFAHSKDLPIVRYVRGLRSAHLAETCEARTTAAQDMLYAFDHALERERGVALEAGTSAVVTLAACRDSTDGPDGRATPTPVDAELISLAGRVLAADPPSESKGLLYVALGRAQQASGLDDDARASFQRALDFEGHHVAEAAVFVLDAWALAEAHLEVETRARQLAADPRLDVEMRSLMADRAADAALSFAWAAEGVERAQRLVRFADEHPAAARVGEALVEAGSLYAEAGRGMEAAAVFERAAAREEGTDTPGTAHLALAGLLDTRGDFERAARVYMKVARAAEAGLSDVAANEAVGLRSRAALRWRRLGQWGDAAAAESDLAEGGTLALAEQRLFVGDLEAARTLLEEPREGEGARWREREEAALVQLILTCGPGNIDALLEAYDPLRDPDQRLAAALVSCVALQAERLAADRATGAEHYADATQHVEALVSKITLIERWTGSLRALHAPVATSRCYLALSLLRVRLATAMREVEGESADALSARADAQRALAWRFWQAAEQQSRRAGFDAALSPRLGSTLGALVDAPSDPKVAAYAVEDAP